MLITRRQLLVSAAAIGIPGAAAVPLPDKPRRSLRLGLLQSRQPFMDPHDVAGSRERAFRAYRVLIRRSLEQQGPLDWLAGGALPLSGLGPFPETVLKQLALNDSSPEVSWLKSFARRHRLRLTFGSWWQEPESGLTKRLLTFDHQGHCQALATDLRCASEGIQLRMPAQHGVPSLSGFAAECGRLGRYGAWIETLSGPEPPPGVAAVPSGGSAVVGPNGQLLAQAGVQSEGCLVAEIGDPDRSVHHGSA